MASTTAGSPLRAAAELIQTLDVAYAEMTNNAADAAKDAEDARKNARAASEIARRYIHRSYPEVQSSFGDAPSQRRRNTNPEDEDEDDDDDEEQEDDSGQADVDSGNTNYFGEIDTFYFRKSVFQIYEILSKFWEKIIQNIKILQLWWFL